MDTYRTEEEQIAAIKKFAAQHGTKVIAAVVAAIALFFAVQNWQTSTQQSKENASFLYSELSAAVVAGKDMTDENQQAFDTAYAAIMSEHKATVYASYASFFKAKLDVEAGELEKAEQSLQWVVDANTNADIKALAILRLARVKAANKKQDEALALLKNKSASFSAAFAEAQGDIYLQQEKNDEALSAYKKSKELKGTSFDMASQMLTMKIESLDHSQQEKLFPVDAGVAVK